MSPFDAMVTVTLHAGGLGHNVHLKPARKRGLAIRLWQWWKDGVEERKAFRRALSVGRWTPERSTTCEDAA